METVTILIALVVILVFAALLFWSIANSRQQGKARAQMAQTLGLTPAEPDETLLAQISALYQTPGNKPRHSLHYVMWRRLPDGELFLFDLVDRDIESDSWIERQAVAIRSSSLRLPPFLIVPKVDTAKYALGGLANKVIEWGVSKVGTPVRFPQFPDFEARYSVTSGDPAAVQRFFDDRLARYFANTEYYTLRAADDMFVFAEIEPGVKPTEPEQVSRRIQRALEIYRLFRQA